MSWLRRAVLLAFAASIAAVRGPTALAAQSVGLPASATVPKAPTAVDPAQPVHSVNIAEHAGIYKVVAVSGEVLARSPGASAWRPVRVGQQLAANQVIQVTTGASVRISQPTQGKVAGMDADEADLLIKVPLIFRLGSGLLRRVDLERHFIDTIPAFDARVGSGSGAQTASSALHFDEAWKKVAAIFTTAPGGKLGTPQALDGSGDDAITLGVTSRHLQLLTPGAHAEMYSVIFPYELQIAWLPGEGAGKDYQVYAWAAHTRRGAPLATTRADHYTMTFQLPGEYQVQVTSADGKWQSEPHLVEVRAAGGQAATAGSSAKAPHFVVARLPAAGAKIVGKAKTAEFYVYWDSLDQLPVTQAELVMLADDNKEVIRTATRPGVPKLLRLPAGRYHWHIDAILAPPNAPTIIEQTVTRRLEIQTEASPLANGLSRLLTAPGVSGTWDLTDGL